MEITFLIVLLVLTVASGVSIMLLVRQGGASQGQLRLQKRRAARPPSPRASDSSPDGEQRTD
ncbi:hypothetical protein GCM10007301_31080 [Azorhizobium oxalatiphilum]|uniref:Uncharacterized protein n=1 Tax=Azorhizobium oxalatiphilum TaxID=980631 RepID=A0A917FE43_9HYPH|nr:hypothetical protein GCM10007301_31080 [Azorhizobium oxalatiphilum]